jgi:glucose-1-phosphate adenylyltransferase
MVNSGINKIGIITHNNYQSLVDHLGTGKDWDLARRSGGLKILPPLIAAYDNGNKLYTTRLESLIGVMNFIARCNEDYIVLSDCDGVCNIDLTKVIDYHVENGADLTIVTRTIQPGEPIPPEGATKITADESNRVTEVMGYVNENTSVEISTNIMVANRMFLLNTVIEASAHGYSHFYKDVVAHLLNKARIFKYPYEEKYIQITSLEGYFKSSMELLDKDVRNGLLNVDNRPVFTKLRNSAPTVYAEGSKVVNSCVADGCVIEGVVENSIIFRGVKIGKGTVVKNSILLQDTYTGKNVSLNYVITDKNVVIRDGRNLSGHETMPFFIHKGAMV